MDARMLESLITAKHSRREKASYCISYNSVHLHAYMCVEKKLEGPTAQY